MLSRYIEAFRQKYGEEHDVFGGVKTAVWNGELHRIEGDRIQMRLYQHDGIPICERVDRTGPAQCTGRDAIERFDRIYNLDLLSPILSDL